MKKSDNFLDFSGYSFFIDIEEFDNFISLNKKSKNTVVTKEIIKHKDGDGNIIQIEEIETTNSGKEIDAAKYEIIKDMIDIIVLYVDENDTALGFDKALEDTPLSFKIAFNTLLNYGIIKELN